MSVRTPGTRPEMTPDYFNSRSAGHLPGLVGLTILSVGPEGIDSRLDVRKDLMAPNGFLHAATVVALADTSCLGRSTQVWDAVVSIEGTEKRIALFRCTQMVLWPK